MKILVADDDLGIFNLIKNILKGCECVHAKTNSQAIGLIMVNDFDFIFLDYDIKDEQDNFVDTWEQTAKFIKEENETSKIVLISGSDERCDLLEDVLGKECYRLKKERIFKDIDLYLRA